MVYGRDMPHVCVGVQCGATCHGRGYPHARFGPAVHTPPSGLHPVPMRYRLARTGRINEL